MLLLHISRNINVRRGSNVLEVEQILSKNDLSSKKNNRFHHLTLILSLVPDFEINFIGN